jgi:hypothetical protein
MLQNASHKIQMCRAGHINSDQIEMSTTHSCSSSRLVQTFYFTSSRRSVASWWCAADKKLRRWDLTLFRQETKLSETPSLLSQSKKSPCLIVSEYTCALAWTVMIRQTCSHRPLKLHVLNLAQSTSTHTHTQHTLLANSNQSHKLHSFLIQLNKQDTLVCIHNRVQKLFI